MPVSTRSQISDGRDDSCIAAATTARSRPSLLRNPHHGLKEKMKALTQFYEQHQNQIAGARVAKQPLPTHHPSVDLVGHGRKEAGKISAENVMKENVIPRAPRPALFPVSDAKENQEHCVQERRESQPFPRRESMPAAGAARKLSLGGSGAQSETRAVKAKRAAGEAGAFAVCGVEGGSRIMVFVRLRPMGKKEKEAGSRSCVRIVDRRDVYLTEFASETDYLRLKRVRGRHFSFDASFTDSTTQQEVYDATTAELVEGVLQGRNGSVFCYGATGAGKTYTMLGTVENPGVMVLAIKDLFSQIRQRSCNGSHVVHLSYLEVYNETVRDLLSPGRPLVLREDKQGIVAAGLTHYRAYSTDEVMALLQQGNLNRTTEPTRVNETSSRSHAILQVVAEYQERDGGSVVSRLGKLSLIDLAGSERALATDQRTLRSLEGANINRSLLALSSCINALVEGKKHIPYRNSKLTQLLKDSLGGPCNTVMIANISPSSLSFGETQNTLHWADRAKEIRTKGSAANEEVLQMPESEAEQAKLLLELQKDNSELRQQLARQQQKLLSIQAQTLAASSCPPTLKVVSTPLRSPPRSASRKTKRSLLSGTCFSTPESKKKDGSGSGGAVEELRQRARALETELERVRKEHLLQIKQKDEFIHELIAKINAKAAEGCDDVGRRVVTRASLRKLAERPVAAAGEVKAPGHRFQSPVQATKKRSFWDSGLSTSPSVLDINGRKTKSHVAIEVSAPPAAAPSMLLQPGFACLRPDGQKQRR